jgi:hypothetical protein
MPVLDFFLAQTVGRHWDRVVLQVLRSGQSGASNEGSSLSCSIFTHFKPLERRFIQWLNECHKQLDRQIQYINAIDMIDMPDPENPSRAPTVLYDIRV